MERCLSFAITANDCESDATLAAALSSVSD